MPVYNFENKQRAVDLFLGLRVDRAASTHLGATTPYFTIAGGPILVTGLFGIVTVASGANACSWAFNPTTGTSGSVSGNLDIDPAVVGGIITITGVGNAAMTYNASATGLAMLATKVVIPIGTLDFIAAAADGATSWTLFYVPLLEASYAVAA